MILSAYLSVAGLSDVGYTFYNANESVNGSRIVAGIVNAGGGWYSVDTTIPAGAVSVRWDSTGTAGANAREYFYNLIASGTDLGQIDLTSGQVKITPGNISSTSFSPGAITNTAIASGAISNSKFATGAISSSTFAAAAINKAALAADTGLVPAHTGTALSGGSNYLGLAASASSVDNFYKNGIVFLTGGTGAGTFGICENYNGLTKVATVSSSFVVTPNATTTYAILPLGSIAANAPTAEDIASEVTSRISSVAADTGGGFVTPEIGDTTFEQIPGGLHLHGVVGNDLTMDVYFKDLDLTDYLFSGYVVIEPEPLLRTYPLTIHPVDLPSGQISVSLTRTQTAEIGPVSSKPWFLQWDGGATQQTRNLLMGKFQLNRF